MPEEYGQKYTFSSGISAIILPFPVFRFEKLEKKSAKKFPIPKPPQKKIKVVDGYETVDNLKDKKYVAKKERAKKEQGRWMGEKILTIALRDCIELDLEQYEDTISALEQDDEPYPENPLERKVTFLTDYVIRSAGDFKALTKIATNLMRVDNQEVDEQINNFPGDMAQSTNNKPETPGASKK